MLHTSDWTAMWPVWNSFVIEGYLFEKRYSDNAACFNELILCTVMILFSLLSFLPWQSVIQFDLHHISLWNTVPPLPRIHMVSKEAKHLGTYFSLGPPWWSPCAKLIG